MFNKVLEFFQLKLNKVYENSSILQNIDILILGFAILTLISSTFMQSDSIGFFALIVIFLTGVKALTKPNLRFELNSFEFWLIIYFLIVIISLAGSTLFSQSLKGFFKTFVYMGYYFSVANLLRNNKKYIPIMFVTVALTTFGEIIIGFLQSFLHLEEISTWQDTSTINPEDVISRIYGTLKPLNPNLFGGYLIAGYPAILGTLFWFIYKKYYKLTGVSLFATLLGIYVIFQTGCRGAYLALMLIFGLTFLFCAKFFWNKYKSIFLSVIGSFTVLFISSIMFVSSLRHRFLSIFAMRNDSSNSFRFNVYHSSVQMFKDNWLLGIGVGNKNFREIYGLYMKTGFDALSAYNIFLEIAVESGVFALIAFVAFLISLLLEGVKNILNTNDINKIILISSSIVAICAVMFHGLVDTIFFRPQLQFVFWSYVGVISSFVLQNVKKSEY